MKIGPSPGWLARRLEALRRPLHLERRRRDQLRPARARPPAARLRPRQGRRPRDRRPHRPRRARSSRRSTARSGALDPDDLAHRRPRPRQRARRRDGRRRLRDLRRHDARPARVAPGSSPAGIRRTSRRHGLKTEASLPLRARRGPGHGDPGARPLRGAHRGARRRHGAPGRGGRAPARGPRAARSGSAGAAPAELLGHGRRRARTRAGSSPASASRSARATPRARPSGSRAGASTSRIEEDLVEEIVRTQGLRRHPRDAAARPRSRRPPSRPRRRRVARVRARARGGRVRRGGELQLRRAATTLAALEPGDAAAGIALKNPISAELAVMRTSLVPSLLRNAAHNRRQRRRRRPPVRDRARLPPPGSRRRTRRRPREALEIAGVLARPPEPGRAGPAPATPLDFYDAKAAVEAVLEALGVEGARFERARRRVAPPARLGGRARGGDAVVGERGRAPPPRRRGLRAAARRARLPPLARRARSRAARLVPRYRAIPRFPAVLRDLAVVVADARPAAAVLEALVRDGAARRGR